MSTFPTDYRLRMPLIIQSSKIDGEDLTNFTVLITRNMLNDAVVDPSNANASQADGGDLAFSSDPSGATRLACDVISWEHDSVTAAGDAAILVAVKVPTVSNTANTTIYLWYDTVATDTQPAASDTYGQYNAYDDNWWAFYPLVTNDLTNRVANTVPLTAVGTSDPPTIGGASGPANLKLGATFFDSLDGEHLTSGSNEVTFGTNQEVTIETWALVTGIDTTERGLIATARDLSREGISLGFASGGTGQLSYRRQPSNGIGVATDSVTTSGDVEGVWSHLVGRDHPSGPASGFQVGYNGVIRATNATDWSVTYGFSGTTQRLLVSAYGSFAAADTNAPCTVDNTQMLAAFHSTPRSDAWIKASYEQIKDPGAFATAGTPTAPLSGPPVNTVAPVISKVV